jgi:tRNA threonylcarbamoyladenosine biosynthesis protein TsaB
MLILAVDTCSMAGSVALLQNTKLLGEVNIDSSLTHSERLLLAIEFLLARSGFNIEDIDGYSLAAGPGSFTGIRIGMSTVKALAFANQKPIAPVSNLAALALKSRYPQSRLLCPIIDAKKSEVYAGLFEAKALKLHEVISQGIYKPDQFLSLLPSHRIISFIGDGAKVFKDKIYRYLKDKARFSSRSHFIAYEVGKLGYKVLERNKGIDFQEVEPIYFRKSQAEEKHS